MSPFSLIQCCCCAAGQLLPIPNFQLTAVIDVNTGFIVSCRPEHAQPIRNIGIQKQVEFYGETAGRLANAIQSCDRRITIKIESVILALISEINLYVLILGGTLGVRRPNSQSVAGSGIKIQVVGIIDCNHTSIGVDRKAHIAISVFVGVATDNAVRYVCVVGTAITISGVHITDGRCVCGVLGDRKRSGINECGVIVSGGN